MVTAAADEARLNRSVYVPIEFSFSSDLDHAVLFRGDDAIRELPATHVFQFTYYPNLEELLPEFERVRVAGSCDGTRFSTEIVVTPATVYFGSKKIELDLEEQSAAFKRRNDARHRTVRLKLRCRAETPSETDTGTR